MTPEQPPSSSRQPRPGVAARRSALGLEGDAAPTVDAAPGATRTAAPAATAAATAAPAATRESLRDSLARIPDLGPDEAAPEVAAPPAAAPAAPAAKAPAPAGKAPAPKGDPAVDALAVAFTAPTPAPTASPAAPAPAVTPAPAVIVPASTGGSGGDAPPTARSGGGRAKPPMWRRVAFAVVLVGLVASIPVLGAAGYKLISDSKDGEFTGAALTSSDPGFEAQVEPTPTAVAIQYDDAGMPNGVTFLSLSDPDGGGAVIFVPLDTEVSEPSFGVDTLRKSYEVVADRPTLARERLASQVGRLLNVGVDEVIDLGNEGWNQLVSPVAPLAIDNPDAVDLGFGQVIPTGETTLNADQVGRYLSATNDGESDLNRLNRHEVVWEAWLKQVAASGKEGAIPGEASAGIGRFAQALAKGPVSYDTLPVTVAEDASNLAKTAFRIDKQAVNELVTNTVPSPTAAVPGSRFTVRLLNGVSADSIPAAQVRQLVSRGGAVTILGNGPSFGNDETTIVYADPENKDLAQLIAKSMGATGKVELNREAPDTVDLTIVLGKDILGDATGSGTPGATTPETTAPGGD